MLRIQETKKIDSSNSQFDDSVGKRKERMKQNEMVAMLITT